MFASAYRGSGLQALTASAVLFRAALPGPPGGHQQHGRHRAEILVTLDRLHQERRDAAIYTMTGTAKRIAQAVFRLHPERRQALFYKWGIIPGAGKLSASRESGP